jgi:hypothetical protein
VRSRPGLGFCGYVSGLSVLFSILFSCFFFHAGLGKDLWGSAVLRVSLGVLQMVSACGIISCLSLVHFGASIL